MPEHDERARSERAVRDAFGPDARIVATTPLHGDASSRRYVRLTLAGARVDSAVVMVLGEGRFTGGSDELGGAGETIELPFVNVARWLDARGLPIPAIHLDRAREDGLLLLEDVGDTTLWAAVDAEPARTRELFGRAVDLLARLQVAGATSPDRACVAFDRRFDEVLARAELEHYVDHAIETRHGVTLSADERKTLLGLLEPLVGPFRDGPFALSHRDYMAWNVHVRGEELVLMDFQDALIGPDAFDLAQLLTDRTTIERVDEALERELIGRFEAAMRTAGRPLAAGFGDRYRRCALQHVLKVIGRFYLLEVVKKKPGYLAYLPSVYEVGRRMLRALPDLAPAVPMLVRWTPELAP
jgi:aminoglycoside/choline kinase family phosphotransferase